MGCCIILIWMSLESADSTPEEELPRVPPCSESEESFAAMRWQEASFSRLWCRTELLREEELPPTQPGGEGSGPGLYGIECGGPRIL